MLIKPHKGVLVWKAPSSQMSRRVSPSCKETQWVWQPLALETALQSLWKLFGEQGLGASDMLNICVTKTINNLLNTYDNYTGKYKTLLNFFKQGYISSKGLIKMKSKVRKAVFPVAGLGTRFLPATKAMPKELLPIIDKPLIQYAAEEAIAAGLDTLIFITGRNKRAIEDHFDGNNELELALRYKR